MNMTAINMTTYYPKFSDMYKETYTMSAYITGTGSSAVTTPAVYITFEEYLQIYRTQPDGLADYNEGYDVIHPSDGEDTYQAYIEGVFNGADRGKNMITANEDYVKLVKFGKYNKQANGSFSTASLWDYKNNFAEKPSPSTSPPDTDNFTKYIYNIKVYVYGWTKETADFIYYNMDRDVSWGAVCTYYSVFRNNTDPKVTAELVTYANPILAKGVFKDNVHNQDLIINSPQPSSITQTRKGNTSGTFSGLNDGKRNEVRYATLNWVSGQDSFTPNAVGTVINTTSGTGAQGIGSAPSGPTAYQTAATSADTVLEWAYYWKNLGFSAMQFETMKNMVILGIKRTNPKNPSDKWTWAQLQSDWDSFYYAYGGAIAGFQPYQYVSYILEMGGSYAEYQQFIMGDNGLDDPSLAFDGQKHHHYDSDAELYPVIQSGNIKVNYRNPLKGIGAIDAYIIMRRNGGSVDIYKAEHKGVQSSNTTYIRAPQWDTVTSATLGTLYGGSDVFNSDSGNLFLSDNDRNRNIKTTSDNAWQWHAFVPAANATYQLQFTKSNSSGTPHPTFYLYQVTNSGMTEIVRRGHETDFWTATTPKLTAGQIYLVRFSGCIYDNQGSPDYNVGILGDLYYDSEVISTRTSYTYAGAGAAFPAISFYVDYIRRKADTTGEFVTTVQYRYALNNAHIEIPFEQAWNDTDKGQLGQVLTGTTSPSNLNIAAELGLVEAVDAMVNWVLFNKGNSLYSSYSASSYYYTTNFTAHTGSNTTTYISYYDYVDWLLNYDQNEKYAEYRREWLTFEAFCVWKRMEVWEKYHYFKDTGLPGSYTIKSDGGKSYAVKFTSIIKTRFGLAFEPLDMAEKRGIYVYYGSNGFNWGTYWTNNSYSNSFAFTPKAINHDGTEYDDIVNILGRKEPHDGRIVPLGPTGEGAYDFLHVEWESDGASYYYNNATIYELDHGSKDWLFITYVSPSFSQFKAAALLKWNALCISDGKKIASTVGYDRFMYYWARNTPELGAIKVRDSNNQWTIDANLATNKSGNDTFWQTIYDMEDYQKSNGTIMYHNNNSVVNGCSRVYTPLRNRGEAPEDTASGTDADGTATEVSTVQHW